MDLLRAIIISPDEELRIALERRIAQSGQVLVLKTLDHYPEIEDAAGTVRAHAAHVVFLDIASNPAVIELGSELQRTIPGLCAVAVHYSQGLASGGIQQVLMELLHGGIRELLTERV